MHILLYHYWWTIITYTHIPMVSGGLVKTVVMKTIVWIYNIKYQINSREYSPVYIKTIVQGQM